MRNTDLRGFKPYFKLSTYNFKLKKSRNFSATAFRIT